MPDIGESTVDFMNALYAIMEPHIQGYNLWQVSSQENDGLFNCNFVIGGGGILSNIALFMTLLTVLYFFTIHETVNIFYAFNKIFCKC